MTPRSPKPAQPAGRTRRLGHQGETAFPGNRHGRGGPLASRHAQGPQQLDLAGAGGICSRWSPLLPLAPCPLAAWPVPIPAKLAAPCSGLREGGRGQPELHVQLDFTRTRPGAAPAWGGQRTASTAPGKALTTLLGKECGANKGRGGHLSTPAGSKGFQLLHCKPHRNPEGGPGGQHRSNHNPHFLPAPETAASTATWANSPGEKPLVTQVLCKPGARECRWTGTGRTVGTSAQGSLSWDPSRALVSSAGGRGRRDHRCRQHTGRWAGQGGEHPKRTEGRGAGLGSRGLGAEKSPAFFLEMVGCLAVVHTVQT